MADQGVRRQSNVEVEDRLAAVEVKNKHKTKFMSSNSTTSENRPEMTFNNLIIGKRYRCSGRLNSSIGGTGNQQCSLMIMNGALEVAEPRRHSDTGTTTEHRHFYALFTAVANTMTVDTSISGGPSGTINGTGTRAGTYVTLEEADDLEETETSDWD